MVGGQWVAHPGGIIDYEVNIIPEKKIGKYQSSNSIDYVRHILEINVIVDYGRQFLDFLVFVDYNRNEVQQKC